MRTGQLVWCGRTLMAKYRTSRISANLSCSCVDCQADLAVNAAMHQATKKSLSTENALDLLGYSQAKFLVFAGFKMDSVEIARADHGSRI